MTTARAVVFGYHDVGVRCLKTLISGGVDIPLVVTVADDPSETQWFGSVAATAAELDKVRAMVAHKKLAGRDKIGVRVGRVINKYKVAKHFTLTIEEDSFAYRVDQAQGLRIPPRDLLKIVVVPSHERQCTPSGPTGATVPR